MIELKITGNNPEDLASQVKGLAAIMGGTTIELPASTAGKAGAGKTNTKDKGTDAGASDAGAGASSAGAGASSGKELKEEDVRKEWTKKKDEGFDVTDLTKTLAKFNVKKMSELKPEDYAAVIAEIKKLSK